MINGEPIFDLELCAQEAVHVIGQIQPHGLLFALSEPDLIVRQVSANVSTLLGTAPETLLGKSFEAVLGARQFETFQSQISSDDIFPADTPRMRLGGSALEVQCIAHRQDDVLIAELELVREVDRLQSLNLNVHIRLPLARMESAGGIQELSQVAAGEIRSLSGFDRVMVYQFDEEWNGEVIAEAKSLSSTSYLGSHFPASDIPAQARRILLLNRLRTIVDIDATPSPIVPEIGPITGRALDLTCSFLRSPAAIHLEYLRNMGVQSSLTVSVIVRGQLWGMIACHHASPRHVDYATRSLCELIGQMLCSQMALRIDTAALQLASHNLLHRFMADIDEWESFVCADHLHNGLLGLFGADGLILYINGVSSSWGCTVETALLQPVVERLRQLSTGGIACSNMLSALVPGAASYSSEVSGTLYLALTEEKGDYLLFLRRELLETVTWAGNPDKSVSADEQGRLRPRTSFKAWKETAGGRSRPWSQLELESARSLRVQLLRLKSSFESARSDRRFRFLADAMPQLIWTATLDGRADYFSERWLSYTGLPIEQLMDRGWKEALHPDDLSHCSELWKQSLATGGDYEVECRIKRAVDGAYRWHIGRAFPLRNQKGDIIQWVGTWTDIDDQKQASRKLEEAVVQRSAELAGAREQLQMVLDGATNVSIIATDMEGLITVFNSGAENMLGYTSAELVGKHTPGIVHLKPEIIARGLQLTAETGKRVYGFDVMVERIRNGQPEEQEWTYVRKDGSQLTVNLVVTALRDARGTTIGFLGIAMDISARKQAEAAARASDEHFRLIVETVQDYALILLDAGGHVMSWNSGAERLEGYQAGEIIGRHLSCFYSPEDMKSGHPGTELRIAAERGRHTEEGWRVRKDGSVFWADVAIAAIYNETGKLRGFTAVVHDITFRKQAEERLSSLAGRLGLATRVLKAGIWDWDLRANTVVWDETMYNIYGLTKGSPVTYQLWINVVTPGDRSQNEALLQSVIASKSEASGEFRITLADGSLRHIHAAYGVISDVDGHAVRLIGVNVDVTKQKLNERQMRQRSTQLELANKDLEQFAYVASHDLKAPLRVIDNASQWLEEDLQEHLTGETREHLNLLRSRVKRMDKLLDDLLEYARIGRATDNRYSELVAGDELMENILVLLALPGFSVEVSPSFAGVQVCRMPLQQILMNLIGNAIKHHDKKTGKIEVNVQDSGDYYAFTVKDDGPGIPLRFQNEVFEMFRTLKPRDQVEGSGMGLAMARKNVELFGGVLHLESAPGEGSTFRFTWPKKQQMREDAI